MSDADRRGGRQYHRGEVEFGRIVGFSDGIFGIAMTLLVAGIAVPEVAKQDLGRALADNADDIYSFGLSFAVIGFLWLGHHGFFPAAHAHGRPAHAHQPRLSRPDRLHAVPDRASRPIRRRRGRGRPLRGRPGHRQRDRGGDVPPTPGGIGALARPMPDDVYRHYMRTNLAPALVFLVSITVVALVEPGISMLMWIASFPLEAWLDRLGGPDVAQWERQAVEAED
jgi:hypothetical protein